ncbi:MAG: tetratricopeptide repeat protein [Acidobacteria bacterium]|nr:tetratricopeptide repeat protein [Acidobacteriota bacterium]
MLQPPVEHPPVLRFGAFEADLRQKELRKHGVRLKLQIQPFEVLALLLERPGALVTREEIQQKLWPGDTFTDFDHGLHNAMNRLREALGDSAAQPRFIETIPRRGYRFIAPVEDVDAHVPAATPAGETPSPISRERMATSQAPLAPTRTRRRALAAGLAVLILLAGLLVLDVGGVRGRLTARAAPPPVIHSLVVLPLQNLSGDPEQEYFADGITDALITELAHIQSLRVISRTSAMHYKGSKRTLPEIARELRVDAVVEGSVVRQNDRVRVNLQLIHAPDDRHLWASQYDRSLKDVLELQSELARAVSQQVQAKLTPQERSRLQAAQRPVNPLAYEAYMRGRHLWNQRSPASLQKSISYYEQALQADPNYALAWAGLAESYTVQGFGGMRTIPPDLALSKGREAALRAVALDDALAEGHAALGYVRSMEGKDAAAETEFRRALQLNPGYAVAYLWYGLHRNRQGDKEEYCSNIRRSHAQDPLNPNVARHVAYCLYWDGQWEKAVALLKKALELYPNQPNTRASLGDIYAMHGNLKEAIPEYERAAELSGNHPNFRLSLAWAYLASGNRKAGFKIWEEVLRRSDAREYAYMHAVMNAEAGRKDEALRWLDLALQQHKSVGPAMIHFDTRLEGLRSDPRFQKLAQRVAHPETARP